MGCFEGSYKQLLLNGINADFCAISAETFVTDLTVNKCEERIVFALADVCAGMDLRASLRIKDVSCKNILTVSAFCAESL